MKKEKTACWIFHSFDKWSEPKDITGDRHIYFKQVRHCKKCNLVEARSVCYVEKVK